MKRSAYLLFLALLSSAWATAQTMDSLNRMQHRGTIRDLGIARAAVLKNPGLPVNRDYTKPVVSTSLNTDALNPSLSIPVVTSNRNYNYASGSYSQVSYQGQIAPVRSAPVIPNGVILPGGTAPSPVVLPVNLPSVPNIVTPIITPVVNPIVPIITPIVNPIVPIITPITNPLTPVITPIVTPVVNPLTPIIKPIVTPIVNPLVPIIKPILPGLPIKFP